MPNISMLDVTGYARLWRRHWLTSRIAMLLCITPLIVFGAFTYLHFAGRFDEIVEQFNAVNLQNPRLTEAERQSTMEFENQFYELAKHALVRYPLVTLLFLAGMAALPILHLVGSGAFRLLGAVLSTLSLGIVVGILLIMALGGFAAPPSPITHHQLVHYHIVGLALLGPLLMIELVVLVQLFRHQLAPGLPPTHHLTRSLTANLTFEIKPLTGVTAEGLAVQLVVIGIVTALLVKYPIWFLIAVGAGLSDVGYLLLQVPVYSLSALLNVTTGDPAFSASDIKSLSTSLDDSVNLAVVLAGATLAHLALRYGRRLNRRGRDEIVLRHKAPVLLLRSFVDDVAGIKPSSLLLRLFRRRKRLEECIGEELSAAGPFVAVGRPGETLPPLGAQRLYLADDQWQGVVKGYIDRSDPIILIAGKTHWVRWELSSIMQRDRLDRLLMLFPPTPAADRTLRWNNLRPAFEGTPWQEATTGLDASRALSVFAGPDGRMIAITSSTPRESDYEAAFRVATYLLRSARG